MEKIDQEKFNEVATEVGVCANLLSSIALSCGTIQSFLTEGKVPSIGMVLDCMESLNSNVIPSLHRILQDIENLPK